MDVHIISPDCVALLARSEKLPGRDGCVRLVRGLLEERGLPQWDVIELDMFLAEGDTLVLARPAGVWVPGYAFDFLEKRDSS